MTRARRRRIVAAIVASAISVALPACAKDVGEFRYDCSKGGLFDSYCEARLQGPFVLASYDGAPIRLYHRFNGGGGISVIQGEDSDVPLAQVGINDQFVVVSLSNKKLYIHDRSDDSFEFAGPYSDPEAKAIVGEYWPEMKRVY